MRISQTLVSTSLARSRDLQCSNQPETIYSIFTNARATHPSSAGTLGIFIFDSISDTAWKVGFDLACGTSRLLAKTASKVPRIVAIAPAIGQILPASARPQRPWYLLHRAAAPLSYQQRFVIHLCSRQMRSRQQLWQPSGRIRRVSFTHAVLQGRKHRNHRSIIIASWQPWQQDKLKQQPGLRSSAHEQKENSEVR